MAALIYTRAELLKLESEASVRLSAHTRRRFDHLFAHFPNRRRRRGCRAGRRLHRVIPVITTSRHPRTSTPKPISRPRFLRALPRIERHANPPVRMIRAGLLNIRSVNNKTDNVPDLLDEYRLNALILTETWHEDMDSAAIKRLRGMGLNVIEAARAIPSSTKLDSAHFVNHGGLAVISKPGINITKIQTKLEPKSFEHLCCRVGCGHTPFMIVAIYRPGSQRVSELFFSEFSVLLESLATFNCPTLIVGDLNIHLENPADADSQRLEQLISALKMQQLVRDPTHDHGGLLDVVIASEDGAPDDVTVTESGISDHRLIHWTVPVACPRPVYTKMQCRSWKHFSQEQFIERLESSPLCQPVDPGKTARELADCYQSVLTNILDDLAPVTEMSVRPRIRRPFYDGDCRQARRRARRLERAFRKKRGTIEESDALTSWRTALKASRSLVRRKGSQYWKRSLDAAQLSTKRTWQHLDCLLGKADKTPRPPSRFSAEDYHSYIDSKATAIRERTANAGTAEYRAHSGSSLSVFSAPTMAEVIACVRSSPNKQCQSDPLPTWLLKDSIVTLAPFLTTLLSTSLASGEFPSPWKHAIVRPHLKRPGLDQADVANYRPISNLPFISKLLERIVNKQLTAYLTRNGLMPKNQSAYRAGHSTETALLKVLNDIVDAIANGELALLCLLDFSAAFDTVDHDILAQRLERSYGVTGQALAWLRDYLSDRSQSVCWNGTMSASRRVSCGVPQGSALGPLLFVLYVADIAHIIESFGLTSHAYADDVQIYASCLPSETDRLRFRLLDCIHEIKQWTEVNRLALNPEKTEFLWASTPRRRHLISRTPFSFDDADITPSTEVRLLGVLLDNSLSFVGHVTNVTRNCFHQLRRIRAIRRYLPTAATIQLVRALIISRVDYCNSVLLGLPDSQLSRLQSVLNASARLIFGARWHDHVTPLLRDKLHWLRIPERIAFKRSWVTFRTLHDPSCPEYLSALIHRPASNDHRRQLRSSSRVRLYVPPPSKTAKFGERSVSRGNPLLWNSLPDSVTMITSSEQFAKNIKTHLFNISYNCTV